MRVTIIKDDNIVGVNGVFRTVDLSSMPEDVRVIQWDGTTGHSEYEDGVTPNTPIESISEILSYVDLWTAAAPPAPVPPTSAELIALAHARINTAYQTTIDMMTAGYPQTEISSWAKQETEARAWMANNLTPTPWLDTAAAGRGITKASLVAKIIENADLFAPLHGMMTGKRQKLRDQIDALGPTPTQEQLNSVQW